MIRIIWLGTHYQNRPLGAEESGMTQIKISKLLFCYVIYGLLLIHSFPGFHGRNWSSDVPHYNIYVHAAMKKNE